jgi:hypothetical protein
MMHRLAGLVCALALMLAAGTVGAPTPGEMPHNTWTLIAQDEQGARRASSFRYVDEGYFLLWGYMGHVTDDYGNPESPWRENTEYDVVAFDPQTGKWLSHLPAEKETEWRVHPPPIHECSSYQGITTGSYRPQLKVREGVLRPDLNIVFDQLTYDSKRTRMLYFTGGRTFSYHVRARLWSDAAPAAAAPPPVSAATLCYDPFNDEAVLAGGGHVAEKGPNGELVGHTGTWLFECSRSAWRVLGSRVEPPPRMNTRLVCDTKNRLLVMFGGDGQSHYLGDTWIYDTRACTWRASTASTAPPPRAGHFTVYDPGTGWVIIGGGYNRRDLTDMWAFDAASDRWMKLKGQVPTGWYIAADLAPRDSLIILTTANKSKGDRMGCNEIYPVRTTYAFKIHGDGLIDDSAAAQPPQKMLKRSVEEATAGTRPDEERSKRQLERIRNMPVNRWVRFDGAGRTGVLRTWGSCSFDTDKNRIVYWGGGHCGYGGSDYDFYDVEQNTWIASPVIAEYPERAWDRGINAAGVTFRGEPFVRHGRKVYAYDPVSRLVVNTKTILLTAGYDPELLRGIEPRNPDLGTGEDFRQSSWRKWVTTTYDPATEQTKVICSGVPGLDLITTTPHGVMGVDHYWDIVEAKNRNDAPNSVYLLDVARREWKRLPNPGPWPRNLYEMTSLVYDSKRDQLILHGGGPQRDELWSYKLPGARWQKIEPRFAAGTGGKPPACYREAVYLPGSDVMLMAGASAGSSETPSLYAYVVGENLWQKVDLPLPLGKRAADLIGQNRAWAYDPKHNLVLMVLGASAGDRGAAEVLALRYRHGETGVKK